MPWRERMGPATFRDVPFFVERAELAAGRKIVLHEYPLRDTPFVEDLGRRSRIFPVDGYVIGDEYLIAKNRLLTVLEEPGSGTLVHPYYGTRICAVGNVRVVESRDEGGMARFSIDFLETEPRPFAPIVVDDPIGRLNRSGDLAMESASTEFTNTYRITTTALAPAVGQRNLPGFVFDSASGLLKGASTDLRSFLQPLVKGTQELASLNRQIDSLYLNADSLVRTPFTLVSRLRDTFASIFRLPSTPGFSRLARLAVTPRVSTPFGSTPARVQERTNFDALQSAVHRFAVITAAQQVVRAPYDHRQDAIDTREEILTHLDNEAEISTLCYDTLVQLAADLSKALPGEGQHLARLLTYTPPTTTPSLVVAYHLYGAITREPDIVARNSIRHPGFILGGRPLDVLSNA